MGSGNKEYGVVIISPLNPSILCATNRAIVALLNKLTYLTPKNLHSSSFDWKRSEVRKMITISFLNKEYIHR